MILERDKFQREPGRSWQIAFWTVVGLSLLAFLVSGPLITNAQTDWLGIVYFSPLVLICCLLGAFAGLGSKVWRWPIVILIAPLVGWYADVSTGGHSITEFEVFVLGVIGVVAATTLSLRICRGSLIRMGPDEYAAADALQFGIKHLLIWTTVAAILVAICQAIWPYVVENGPPGGGPALLSIFGFSSCLAVATVIDIWAMLGKRLTATKIIVVVFITTASAIASFTLMVFNPLFFATVAVVNQVLAIVLMFTLRKQGYRFVKRSPRSA